MNQNQVKEEIKKAMLARDVVRTNVFRGVSAAFTNELVSKGKKPTDTLTDDECLAVIKRGVKQRKDSIDQFEKGGRQDLVDKEKAELQMLEALLPAQMGEEEIMKIAKAKATELGATDKTKAGVLMSALMKELKGKADGMVVKKVVEDILVNR